MRYGAFFLHAKPDFCCVLLKLSLTGFQGFVYWSDEVTRSICRANKHNGRDLQALLSNVTSPGGVLIIQPVLQPKGMPNQKGTSSHCRSQTDNCCWFLLRTLCLWTSKGSLPSQVCHWLADPGSKVQLCFSRNRKKQNRGNSCNLPFSSCNSFIGSYIFGNPFSDW